MLENYKNINKKIYAKGRLTYNNLYLSNTSFYHCSKDLKVLSFDNNLRGKILNKWVYVSMENRNINLKLKIACSRQVISTVPINYLSINSEKINCNKKKYFHNSKNLSRVLTFKSINNYKNININYFYKPINIKKFSVNIPKGFSCYYSSSCSINYSFYSSHNFKIKKIFSKGFKNFTYGKIFSSYNKNSDKSLLANKNKLKQNKQSIANKKHLINKQWLENKSHWPNKNNIVAGKTHSPVKVQASKIKTKKITGKNKSVNFNNFFYKGFYVKKNITRFQGKILNFKNTNKRSLKFTKWNRPLNKILKNNSARTSKIKNKLLNQINIQGGLCAKFNIVNLNGDNKICTSASYLIKNNSYLKKNNSEAAAPYYIFNKILKTIEKINIIEPILKAKINNLFNEAEWKAKKRNKKNYFIISKKWDLWLRILNNKAESKLNKQVKREVKKQINNLRPYSNIIKVTNQNNLKISQKKEIIEPLQLFLMEIFKLNDYLPSSSAMMTTPGSDKKENSIIDYKHDKNIYLKWMLFMLKSRFYPLFKKYKIYEKYYKSLLMPIFYSLSKSLKISNIYYNKLLKPSYKRVFNNLKAPKKVNMSRVVRLLKSKNIFNRQTDLKTRRQALNLLKKLKIFKLKDKTIVNSARYLIGLNFNMNSFSLVEENKIEDDTKFDKDIVVEKNSNENLLIFEWLRNQSVQNHKKSKIIYFKNNSLNNTVQMEVNTLNNGLPLKIDIFDNNTSKLITESMVTINNSANINTKGEVEDEKDINSNFTEKNKDDEKKIIRMTEPKIVDDFIFTRFKYNRSLYKVLSQNYYAKKYKEDNYLNLFNNWKFVLNYKKWRRKESLFFNSYIYKKAMMKYYGSVPNIVKILWALKLAPVYAKNLKNNTGKFYAQRALQQNTNRTNQLFSPIQIKSRIKEIYQRGIFSTYSTKFLPYGLDFIFKILGVNLNKQKVFKVYRSISDNNLQVDRVINKLDLFQNLTKQSLKGEYSDLLIKELSTMPKGSNKTNKYNKNIISAQRARSDSKKFYNIHTDQKILNNNTSQSFLFNNNNMPSYKSVQLSLGNIQDQYIINNLLLQKLILSKYRATKLRSKLLRYRLSFIFGKNLFYSMPSPSIKTQEPKVSADEGGKGSFGQDTLPVNINSFKKEILFINSKFKDMHSVKNTLSASLVKDRLGEKKNKILSIHNINTDIKIRRAIIKLYKGFMIRNRSRGKLLNSHLYPKGLQVRENLNNNYFNNIGKTKPNLRNLRIILRKYFISKPLPVNQKNGGIKFLFKNFKSSKEILSLYPSMRTPRSHEIDAQGTNRNIYFNKGKIKFLKKHNTHKKILNNINLLKTKYLFVRHNRNLNANTHRVGKKKNYIKKSHSIGSLINTLVPHKPENYKTSNNIKEYYKHLFFANYLNLNKVKKNEVKLINDKLKQLFLNSLIYKKINNFNKFYNLRGGGYALNFKNKNNKFISIIKRLSRYKRIGRLFLKSKITKKIYKLLPKVDNDNLNFNNEFSYFYKGILFSIPKILRLYNRNQYLFYKYVNSVLFKNLYLKNRNNNSINLFDKNSYSRLDIGSSSTKTHRVGDKGPNKKTKGFNLFMRKNFVNYMLQNYIFNSMRYPKEFKLSKLIEKFKIKKSNKTQTNINKNLLKFLLPETSAAHRTEEDNILNNNYVEIVTNYSKFNLKKKMPFLTLSNRLPGFTNSTALSTHKNVYNIIERNIYNFKFKVNYPIFNYKLKMANNNKFSIKLLNLFSANPGYLNKRQTIITKGVSSREKAILEDNQLAKNKKHVAKLSDKVDNNAMPRSLSKFENQELLDSTVNYWLLEQEKHIKRSFLNPHLSLLNNNRVTSIHNRVKFLKLNQLAFLYSKGLFKKNLIISKFLDKILQMDLIYKKRLSYVIYNPFTEYIKSYRKKHKKGYIKKHLSEDINLLKRQSFKNIFLDYFFIGYNYEKNISNILKIANKKILKKKRLKVLRKYSVDKLIIRIKKMKKKRLKIHRVKSAIIKQRIKDMAKSKKIYINKKTKLPALYPFLIDKKTAIDNFILFFKLESFFYDSILQEKRLLLDKQFDKKGLKFIGFKTRARKKIKFKINRMFKKFIKIIPHHIFKFFLLFIWKRNNKYYSNNIFKVLKICFAKYIFKNKSYFIKLLKLKKEAIKYLNECNNINFTNNNFINSKLPYYPSANTKGENENDKFNNNSKLDLANLLLNYPTFKLLKFDSVSELDYENNYRLPEGIVPNSNIINPENINKSYSVQASVKKIETRTYYSNLIRLFYNLGKYLVNIKEWKISYKIKPLRPVRTHKKLINLNKKNNKFLGYRLNKKIEKKLFKNNKEIKNKHITVVENLNFKNKNYLIKNDNYIYNYALAYLGNYFWAYNLSLNQRVNTIIRYRKKFINMPIGPNIKNINNINSKSFINRKNFLNKFKVKLAYNNFLKEEIKEMKEKINIKASIKTSSSASLYSNKSQLSWINKLYNHLSKETLGSTLKNLNINKNNNHNNIAIRPTSFVKTQRVDEMVGHVHTSSEEKQQRIIRHLNNSKLMKNSISSIFKNLENNIITQHGSIKTSVVDSSVLYKNNPVEVSKTIKFKKSSANIKGVDEKDIKTNLYNNSSYNPVHNLLKSNHRMLNLVNYDSSSLANSENLELSGTLSPFFDFLIDNKSINMYNKLGLRKIFSEFKFYRYFEFSGAHTGTKQIITYSFTKNISRTNTINSFDHTGSLLKLNISVILKYFFNIMGSALISKPVFVFSHNKVTIQISYFIYKKLFFSNKNIKNWNEYVSTMSMGMNIYWPIVLKNYNKFSKRYKEESGIVNSLWQMKDFNSKRKPFNDKIQLLYPGNMPYLAQHSYSYHVFKRIRKLKKLAGVRNNHIANKYVKNPIYTANYNRIKRNKPYVKNTLSLFYKELNFLTYFLENFFNCSIKLELSKINTPYSDTNIMAQLIGINGEENKFDRIKRLFLSKFFMWNPNDPANKFRFNIYNDQKPFYVHNNTSRLTEVSGIKVRVAGRFYKHKIIPRKTVSTFQKGSLARKVVKLVEKARFTNKSKRGSFSVTVWISNNF